MQYSLKEMEDAALLMFNQNKYQEAFDISCIALKNKNAPRIFSLILSTTALKIPIKAYNPIIKNALLQAIDAEGIDPQIMSFAWVEMVYQDPAFDPVRVFAAENYNFEMRDWQNLQDCISDPFFLSGLRNIVITSREIETALRNIRKALLLNLLPENLLKTSHLEFISALSENCYNNEYAFYVTEEEKVHLNELALDNPCKIAVLSCYESLSGKDFDRKISAVQGFKRIVQTQVIEPQEEENLKSSIRTLKAIEDDVSVKVRGMYEQNPYPRWRRLSYAEGTNDCKADILVAGSGTGRYLIQLGIAFPQAKFTAVDITKASLAYSMRMAAVYGVKNADFFQCDILELDGLEKQFDFINCSGVLHHMADPVAGWRSLTRQLKPGGFMLIGLYSTLARKIIFEGRDDIRKNNFVADAEGIRAFRSHVFNLPKGHKLERLITYKDFYTLSETRDLLFHVQEKTYTIPDIAEMLDDLGLEFMGFKMPAPEFARMYKEQCPEDRLMLDLKNWDKFERSHPHLFAGMYNFLCKKKDGRLSDNAVKIIQAGIFG